MVVVPFLVLMTFVVTGAQAVSLPAEVSVEYVSPQAFSPDGDGSDDTSTVRFCLTASANVTAAVHHGDDVVVRVLANGKSFPSGCSKLIWDGTAEDGSPAPEGTYQVRLAAVNDSAQTTTANTEIDLLRRTPGAVTSPAPGAILAGTATFAFIPTDGIAVDQVQFSLSGSGVACSSPQVSRADSDGAFRVSWDTAGQCGDGARSLTASVSWVDRFGARHWWTSPAAEVRLANPAAPVVSLAAGAQVFSPNGDQQEDVYGFRWCAVDDVDGGSVQTVVRVRDAQDAVVRTLDEQMGTPSAYCQFWWGGGTYASWDGLADDGTPAPDGDYTIEVASTDGSGLTGTATALVVVDRRPPGVLTNPTAGTTVAGTAPFVFTPTDGIRVEQVDYQLGGTWFSAYNPSPNGTWRTTQAVGGLASGAADLTYTVRWTDRLGGSHWYSRTLQVAVDPTAIPLDIEQDAVSGTAPFTAELTVRASDPNGAALRVDVDWGDGSTKRLELASPYDPLPLTHEYAEPGTYRAFVSVSNGTGGYASQSVPVSAGGRPNTAPQVTVSTTLTTGVAPLDTLTTLTATDADGDPLTYRVDFGDGSPVATGSLPREGLAHRYTGVGTHLLRTEITDGQLAVVRYTRVVVGLSEPLRAEAGDALSGVVGTPVHLDGSASAPSAGITGYTWDPGDGTGATNGSALQHAYTRAGTYTATLTVRSGTTTTTDTTTVTVTDPPAPRGLTVSVTGGGSPVSGAQLTVIMPDGRRVTATTDGSGRGLLPDLPEGSVTAYVLAPGYRPAVVTGTVAEGHGSASVALMAGEVGAATLEQHRMDIEEIRAAGIDVADPQNTHVYEAEIHLFFEPVTPTPADTVHIYVTPTEVLCASNCAPPAEAPGCSPTGDNPCFYLPATAGDRSGGYTAYPQVIYVADQPVMQWLVLPVRASFLKEFFQAQLVVQNFTEGFTFTNGSASIELPPGLSLAPTSTPQSLTPTVPDVPGGDSKTVTWTIRGDAEGEYGLAADYVGSLQPIDRPVRLRAVATNPLKVWGASALDTTITVDDYATRWAPYRVDVEIRNVSDTPVYNLQFQMSDRPADAPDWQAPYVFAPGYEERLYSTAALPPCTGGQDCTFEASYVVYPGLGNDEVPDLKVVTGQSFVQRTGGDVDLAPEIRTRCGCTFDQWTDTPPYAGAVQVTVVSENGQDKARLTWSEPEIAEDAGLVTGYRIWTRQRLQTASSDAEDWLLYESVPSFGNPVETFEIPSTARALGRYYSIETVFLDGRAEPHHGIGVGPARYVALGDSYSSGEGVPAFTDGTEDDLPLGLFGANKCHRSAQGSYSQLIVDKPPARVNLTPATFAACSGAVSADVLEPNPKNNGEPAQIDHVNQFTDLITLSMGGNDIGFSDIAIACLIRDCTPDIQWNAAVGSNALLNGFATMWDETGPFRDSVNACANPVKPVEKLICWYRAYKFIDSTVQDVDDFFSDIARSASPRLLSDDTLQKRLSFVYQRLAAKAPNAGIEVMLYPDLIGWDTSTEQCTLIEAAGVHFGLDPDERRELRSIIGTLNGEIRGAVDDANAALARAGRPPAVDVVDGSSATPQPLCANGVLNGDKSHYHAIFDPFGLSPATGPYMYSLHPNAWGHEDYAEALREELTPSASTVVLLHPETLTQAATVTLQGSSPVLQSSTPRLQSSASLLQGGGSTLVARLSWPGSTATLHLTAPDGTEVDASTPGVTVQTTLTSQTLTVPGAQAGEWKVAVYGDDVHPGEPASVSAYEIAESPQPPQVIVTGSPVDAQHSTFDLASSVTGNAPAGSTYTWYFSDGTTATGPTVQHTFAAEAASWWATLEVRTPDGRSGWGSVELGGPPSAPVLTQPVPPTGTIGTQFSMPVTATGRPVPRFDLASGELPPGIALDPVTGLVSGTPTTGGTWTFTVGATNSEGTAVTDPVTVVVAKAPTFTAAEPPASLTAGQQVSYALAASGAPAPSFAATGTLPPGLTLGADGVLSGTPTTAGVFAFSVTATNAAGTATAGPFTVTVAEGIPGAPTGVTATPADGAATVSWQALTSTGGSDLTGYTVIAQPGGRGCTTDTALTCTVTGLTNGTAYTFTVTATNAGGRTSAPSAPSAAVVPAGAPGAPVAVAVLPGDGTAAVSWDPPDTNGGSPLTGYTVTASPGTATCRTAETRCSLTGLTNGTSYAVVVAAETAAGSTAAVPVTVVPAGPPSAPTDVTAAAADRAATVSWTAPDTGNGSPLTGYTVTAEPGGASCTSTAASCTVTGLTNGTAYRFSVVATNGVGLSSVPSEVSNEVTPVGAPDAPRAVTVAPGDRRIDVSWQPPASTGGTAITRYVAVAEPGGASCATHATTCALTGLTNGTAYVVTVRVENGAGLTGTSAPTAPVTPLAPPAAPTGARAVAGDGSATVSWRPGTAAGTGPADGYVVTSNPGGATCRVTGATSCTVTGLTNGTSYRFTVVALDSTGRTSAASAPTATVVPIGAPSAPRAVAAEAGNRHIEVSWQGPASTGGSPLASYRVTATPVSPGAGARSCTTTGRSCVVTGLVNGTAYRVQVVAVNRAGKVSAPAQLSGTVTPFGRPTAPQRVTSTPSRGSLLVSWAAADGNGSPITRYTATAFPGRASCVAEGRTSCTIRGLDHRRAYTVQVTATNAEGLVSAPSVASSPVRPRRP